MRVSTKTPIAAPAQSVWAVVGPGFGSVGEWATVVAESSPLSADRPDGSPTGRACTIAEAGFDQLVEEITRYEPHARRLTYRASSGMPSFVDTAINTWSVLETADSESIFTMDIDVTVARRARLLAPALGLYLRWFARRTGRDLKAIVETGAVSGAKQARLLRRKRSALDRIVTANAAFSAASGSALAMVASFWSAQFGDAPAPLFVALGVGLLVFATIIAAVAGRGASPREGKAIAALDAGWVLGTVALLAFAADRYTGAGMAAAIGAAVAVGGFGWAQYRAASRLTTRVAPRAFLEPVRSLTGRGSSPTQ